MKKIITLLALLLITFSYSAQTKIHSYAVDHGTWSNYTDSWSWDGWKSANITFTIQGSIIMVSDVAKSTYVTYGESVEGDNYVAWDAVDEKGTDCKFMMSTNVAEENYILVIYQYTCFKYAY